MGITTRQGNDWSNSTITWMLANPVYIGEVREKDQRFPGEHEPLIDTATFEAAQRGLPTKLRARRATDRAYTLVDVLFCGRCGSRMTAHYVSKRNGGKVAYYRCTRTFKRGWDACPVRQVNADKMESCVADLVSELAASPSLVAEEARAANRDTDTLLRPLREKQTALNERKAELQQSIRRLIDVVEVEVEGVAALAALRQRLAERERDIALVDHELQQVREEIRRYSDNQVEAGRISEVLQDFRLLYDVASPNERQELIRLLFKRVEYNGPGQAVVAELYDRNKVEATRYKSDSGSKPEAKWRGEPCVFRTWRYARDFAVPGAWPRKRGQCPERSPGDSHLR